MTAAYRRAANPLLLACQDLSEASVADLGALAPSERAVLRGQCQRWADMASFLDTQEIADFVADRQAAGLPTFTTPGSN